MVKTTRTIKNDVRVDRLSGIRYNNVSINQALKIADRAVGFTWLDAMGAIRTFLDNLDAQDKGIYMPKKMMLDIWLENLKLAYLQKTRGSETLANIKKHKSGKT
jgi:hypothetical protein